MIGRLRMVGVGAVCLAMFAVVPVTAQQAAVEQGLRGSSVPLATGVTGQEAAIAATPTNPYTPPTCVPGVPFSDITCTTGFDPWIEQFGLDGITAGCGGGKYCPGTPVTRDQMAVFIEKAMRGTSAWSPGDLGNANTGLGNGALLNNSGYAQMNTAIGYQALVTQSFTNGGSAYPAANTAVGIYALYFNQPDGGSGGLDGIRNTAVGAGSLVQNTTGFENTAVGGNSLYSNATGFRNTALGWNAGARVGEVITGYTGTSVMFANTVAGDYNTFVGIAGATVDVNNCTAVGMDAYCDAGNQVRLGNYFVTSIGGKVGFSALSDARAKSDIRDLDIGLEFVKALRPVSYHLNGGNGRTDMGFVAQDIETLLGDDYNVLGIGGDKDRTLSLRYTDLIAPMVKAMQEQEAQITDQAKTIQLQQAQIEALKGAVAALQAHLAPK